MSRLSTFVGTFLVLSGSILLAWAESSAPAPAPPAGAITCSMIVQEMTPCLNFITKKEDKPSAACCQGAKQLNEQNKEQKDRQTTCGCLKTALQNIQEADPERINQLPQQCGLQVQLPKIDRDIDCSQNGID
ncbi:hypothetical protein UlMin_021693 [Ulmus minor]